MGYCDHTDAEVFALTRQRRLELRLKRLRERYGETVKAAGHSIEFDPAINRSINRNARKKARRARRPIGHTASPGGPHTSYVAQSTFAKLRAFQGNTCYLCHTPFTVDDDATQDHVVPRSRGGRNGGNILLAHALCNHLKGDRMPYLEELDYLEEIKRKFASHGRVIALVC